MEDFSLPATELQRRGVAEAVKNGQDLANVWLRALNVEAELKKKAVDYIESLSGASKLAWNEIASCLR